MWVALKKSDSLDSADRHQTSWSQALSSLRARTLLRSAALTLTSNPETIPYLHVSCYCPLCKNSLKLCALAYPDAKRVQRHYFALAGGNDEVIEQEPTMLAKDTI